MCGMIARSPQTTAEQRKPSLRTKFHRLQIPRALPETSLGLDTRLPARPPVAGALAPTPTRENANRTRRIRESPEAGLLTPMLTTAFTSAAATRLGRVVGKRAKNGS